MALGKDLGFETRDLILASHQAEHERLTGRPDRAQEGAICKHRRAEALVQRRPDRGLDQIEGRLADGIIHF
jgi:hypothetical protein